MRSRAVLTESISAPATPSGKVADGWRRGMPVGVSGIAGHLQTGDVGEEPLVFQRAGWKPVSVSCLFNSLLMRFPAP